ncbi:MAG: hypothetical protein Q9162_007119 [Coniocarpon cinnabarinum]
MADDIPSSSISLCFTHAGQLHTALLPTDATLQHLAEYALETLQIPLENQKWLVSPKPGLIKPPFDDTSKPPPLLTDLVAHAKKFVLIGSTTAQVASLNKSVHAGAMQANRRAGNGSVKTATPTRTRDWKSLQDEINYTFQSIKPLDHLPFPERSTAYLERLRDDPGVKAAMIKHKWSVSLLTELDPAENTSHESRTLGLNKNAGETILLRLRTDAYDGYRDYKTVRNCLCHELAHNVHGEHNRQFYDLMKQIQDEVEKNDWKHGGHALSKQEYYEPETGNSTAGHEWEGGSRKLGSDSATMSASHSPNDRTTRDRREMMAKAAEERMKRNQDNSR